MINILKIAITTKYLFFIVLQWCNQLEGTNAKLVLPQISILNNRLANDISVSRRGELTTNTSLIKITSQNDQTVYVVPYAVLEVTITCNATYPITWDLQQSRIHSDAISLLSVKSLRTVGEIFDATSFNYSTNIHFYAENDKLTGKYVCASTAYSNIQSSVYIFWEGISQTVLINTQENVTVYVENNEATLPCRVSKPNLKTPKLFKEITNSTQKIPLNDSVSFDPKVGFLLKDLPNPVGSYKCVVKDNDYVIVNVVARNETASSKQKSNATFVYTEAGREIKCCSSSRRPPSLHMYYCNHPATCSFREHNKISPYYLTSVRRRKKSNCATFKIHYYHTGVVRCIGDGIDIYKEFIKPIRKIYEPWNSNITTPVYFSWAEIEPQQMVDIASTLYIPNYYRRRRYSATPQTSETYFSGQNIIFRCQYSPYYFSEGVQWALKWKNSTVTLFKNNRTNVNRERYYGRGVGTPLRVLIHIDLEAVICFAPVWNSSAWIPKTKYLYVNESIAPLIKLISAEADRQTEQTAEWTVNETTKAIYCSATGWPQPTIIWKKDGKTLYNSTNVVISSGGGEGKRTTNSNLTVLRISYSSHGKYVCKADNFGGSTSEEFSITVLESKSWTTAIVITFAVIIIAILLLGLGLIYRKMDSDKKTIQHLATVAFKDVATRHETIGTDVHNSSQDNGKVTHNLLH